jgi:hypothetical protein
MQVRRKRNARYPERFRRILRDNGALWDFIAVNRRTRHKMLRWQVIFQPINWVEKIFKKFQKSA